MKLVSLGKADLIVLVYRLMLLVSIRLRYISIIVEGHNFRSGYIQMG